MKSKFCYLLSTHNKCIAILDKTISEPAIIAKESLQISFSAIRRDAANIYSSHTSLYDCTY